MTNKYEERLGTERGVTPLWFQDMAARKWRPVCQSALQHCRPYLHRTHTGHRNRCAGGSGSDHLARCADFFFLRHCGCGGGARYRHCPRTGQPSPCRKDTQQWLHSADSFHFAHFVHSLLSFMEPILLFTGASEHTLGYAEDYLSIYLLGTLFVEVSTGLNAFINAQGRPAVAMCSVLIGALLNIILDPIFIFWLDMGVKGAALATVLSQACSAVWVLSFLFSRRASLPLERRYMKLEKSIVLSMLALGVSPFIMASTESLVGFVPTAV